MLGLVSENEDPVGEGNNLQTERVARSDYAQMVPGREIVWEAGQYDKVDCFDREFLVQEGDSDHALVRGRTTKAIQAWNIVQQLE